jgi:ribosomal subunit interface protein
MIKKMEIATDGYDLSDDLKQRIQDKIAGLDEYMDTLDRGHVTVSWEGGPNEQTKIRAQLWGPGHEFDASDTDWKAITAIDNTHSKLESQIRRVHEKSISERDHNRR